MSKFTPPDDIRIAALEQRGRTAHYDLMAPGRGTPWEDRGSVGTVSAFIRTCLMSMGRPGALLDSIRRTSTPTDAAGFVIGVGVIWGLSALIHTILWFLYLGKQHGVTVDPTLFWVGAALRAAAFGVGAFLVAKIATAIYYKLIAHDMTSKAPQVLAYNVISYGLGPSLLALIPIAGPILALVWIPFVWLVGGVKRLYVRGISTFIVTMITFVITAGIAIGVFFLADLVWTLVTNGAVQS